MYESNVAQGAMVVKVGMSSITTKMVLRYGCGILLQVQKATEKSPERKLKWCML